MNAKRPAQNPWERVTRAALRRRVPILVVVTLATGLSVAALPRLQLQSGIYELFPRDPGPIADLAAFGALFGASREVVVLVSGDDPGAVARATHRAASELARSPRFTRVRAGVESLALIGAMGRSLLLLADEQTWPRVRQRLTGPLEPQVARLRRLLLSPLSPGREALTHDPLGISELLLEGLESDVDRQSGLFAARDGRAALIFARPAADDPQAIHAALRRVARRVQQAHEVKLRFSGAPVYSYHFARTMRHDLTLSSAVALTAVILVLLLFFRSVRLLPLATLVGAVAVCWTLALAAVFHLRLNMLSLAFAALCIGMGLDALIHITATTRESAGQGRERVVAAVNRLFPALLAASLTTVAAFLLFALSSFQGLAMTGLLAACGIGLTLVLTLGLAPGLAPAVAPAGQPGLLDRMLARIASGDDRRRRFAVLVLAGAAGLGAAVAGSGLRFSSDLTRLAPASFPPVQTDRAIARHFERQHHRVILLVRGASRERVLQVNDELARRLAPLRRQGSVASFRSLSSLLPSRRTQLQRLQRLRALDPPRLARRLQQALERGGLRPELFAPFLEALTRPSPLVPERLPEALRPLVERQLGRSGARWIAATLVYPAADATTDQLLRLAHRLEGDGVRVGVTGAKMAGVQMARLLRRDLLRVSLLSLAAVLLLVALLLRRAWPVAATLLSLVWTGVAFVGALRLLGYEVDLYNLMVLPVLVGYGVDDHIYVVRRALERGSRLAVRQSGRAVVITTLTSIAGFGALLLCDLPGLRALGASAILGLTLGMVGSLLVLPALLGPGRGRV